MIKLYTTQLMGKHMIIMQADDGGILGKVRVIRKPDCRRNAKLFDFIYLFQVILRKHMQPVHDEYCSRHFPRRNLQHRIRRAEHQLTDQQPECFCDACIYRLKALGNIHQLKRPACCYLRRIQAFHSFT
ncbi:hypothetical protein D3C81_1797800 [compost metagenome]